MKKTKILLLLIVIASIGTWACKKSDSTEEDSNTTAQAASFKIAANSFTVSKPYLGIFNNSGVINNTLTLTASDGSKIEFNFKGNSPSTYPLASYSNGYFKSATGKQYNSTSGELIISSYSIDGATYKASGTFHFRAKSISSANDSLEVTEGSFTNASN